jgi:tetratricopeptide (TPR) repeat protein
MLMLNVNSALRISATRIVALLCFAFSLISSVYAQQAAPSNPLMLVVWYGSGAIELPYGPNWKLENLNLYDNRSRPVVQFKKVDARLHVSYIIFEDPSGKPTSEGCRDDTIGPILLHVKKNGWLVSNRVDGEVKNAAGDTLVTTSYQIDMNKPGVHSYNLYGFAGNAKTCTEIHISGEKGTAAEEEAMKAVLTDFHPDLTYQPNAVDYFMLATLLFKSSPALSVPYYDSSLKALPNDVRFLTPRRIVTDQLVMALGMSGDLKNSRAYAERAIASDPDYPINYYNLACADAEQGNATDAKLHLQQAFDRRANVLKGESMPDPTKDDSILKLKKNKEFWDFVITLPKN